MCETGMKGAIVMVMSLLVFPICGNPRQKLIELLDEDREADGHSGGLKEL